VAVVVDERDVLEARKLESERLAAGPRAQLQRCQPTSQVVTSFRRATALLMRSAA
jgi:hypothetical protein